MSAKKISNQASATDASRKRTEKAEHVAAYDAMRAARPLRPPTLRMLPARVTPGQAALAEDIRSGVYAVLDSRGSVTLWLGNYDYGGVLG